MYALRSMLAFLVGALVLAPAGADAQEYRWVRGTVTEVTDAALTIHAAGPDLNLVFTLDESSIVIARGMGSWVHPPEQTRPGLSNVVRIGDTVEVHYVRNGRNNYAGLVLTAAEDARGAGQSLAGRVWASSDRSLTVLVDGREHTFTVTPATRLIAPRAGGRQPPGEAGKPGLSDVPARNDIVLVYYRLEGTTLLATGIRVLSSRR